MSEHERLTKNILAVVTAYRAVNPLATSTISRKFLNGGTILSRLESPEGLNFTVVNYDTWVRNFAKDWPDGAAWPPNVPRPPARAAESTGT